MKGHVNSSGFPLQIVIKYQVDEMQNRHGFRTIYSEHSWKNNDTSESGFIDLILGNVAETLYVVVECKRVKDTSWIFMRDQRTVDSHGLTPVALKKMNWPILALAFTHGLTPVVLC